MLENGNVQAMHIHVHIFIMENDTNECPCGLQDEIRFDMSSLFCQENSVKKVEYNKAHTKGKYFLSRLKRVLKVSCQWAQKT